MIERIQSNRALHTALSPLSWIYGGVAGVRNFLFDKRLLQSGVPPINTICVGNLTVGGTGKTPFTEYLISKLISKYSVATLSRGYGRLFEGFQMADPDSLVEEIGDEPMQYYLKFGDRIKVAVSEDRLDGSLRIHQMFPEVDLLLLDDGFQHRRIRPDINILLSDYNRPFYADKPFPAGMLRENRSGAKRADVVVVTKCPPNLLDSEKEIIRKEIRKYAGREATLFFSFTEYGLLTPFAPKASQAFSKVILVSGIAQPQAFLEKVSGEFEVVNHLKYSDHHFYTANDFDSILSEISKAEAIITSEKDMVKLKPLAEAANVAEKFFYWPVEVNLNEDEKGFSTWLRQEITRSFR